MASDLSGSQCLHLFPSVTTTSSDSTESLVSGQLSENVLGQHSVQTDGEVEEQRLTKSVTYSMSLRVKFGHKAVLSEWLKLCCKPFLDGISEATFTMGLYANTDA